MPLSNSKHQHFQGDMIMSSYRQRASFLNSNALAGDSTLESKKEPKQRATDRESYRNNRGGLDSNVVGRISIRNSPKRDESASLGLLGGSLHEMPPRVPDHILIETGMSSFKKDKRKKELDSSLLAHHAR